MECTYCEIIKKKKDAFILYEDDLFIAFLSDNTIVGHTIIIPKNHYIILEMVPDEILNKLGKIINKLSLSLVESISAFGINVIINNGTSAKQQIPHFSIDLIPRFDNDNINFFWNPKQLNSEEFNEIELKIKDALTNSINLKNGLNDIENKTDSNKEDDDENYLIKSLNRIP
jgi:histidine triad (HIT) family protein